MCFWIVAKRTGTTALSHILSHFHHFTANGGTAAVSPSQATPAVSTTTADGGVDGEGGDSLSRTTRGSNAINGIKRGISTLSPGSLAAATVDSRKAAVLQEVMCETGSHSVVVAVDKIFSGSVRLDGDAIVDFVKALCQVRLLKTHTGVHPSMSLPPSSPLQVMTWLFLSTAMPLEFNVCILIM